jgi:hypothetical protein
MAQTSTNVYSLNAVGYINVTAPPGYSIVADQLWNSSGSNTLANTITVPADSSEDGSRIYKFNGTGYSTYTFDSFSSPPFDPNGSATLNPGEAAFFYNNTSTNIIFTFVGTVPQGTNTVVLNQGYNLVSSPVPETGGITTTLGLAVAVAGSDVDDGDRLYSFSNNGVTSGYATYTVDSFSTPPWDPSEPTINVGQGFFYYIPNTNPAKSWVRTFSVND